MKTILVLSSHPDFAETIRLSLSPEHYRVVHRLNVDEGEPLLVHNLASACILDADLLGVESIWVIERLRRRDSKTPIITYTESVQSDWEEEAILRGVTHVLTKPVRQRSLNAVLERFWNANSVSRANVSPIAARNPSPVRNPFSGFTGQPINTGPTLDVLRDFSSILTHSLDAEAMLKQFLQFLREILSINRAVIFLNRPCAPLAEISSPEEGRQLHVAAAIGLPASLLEHFKLNFESGIGAQISWLGRILRRDSEEARADNDVQKEFELLGSQVAVPILDRESLIGVALLDGRVTGESLVNSELELIFHLLEQVGLALRNIWLHDQLAGNHEMMADVLRELSSACIVVGRDLKVLHANKAARRHFGHKNARTGSLEFSDLPQTIGAKIFQVLKTGAALEPFRYEPENSSGTIYSISIVPFQRSNSATPGSALLIADDLSQTEQLGKLEIEAANLRLIRLMADRLAHEIGNAMVPLSTHQQLLGEKFGDKEFRQSLDRAMAEGVKRVTRLVNQMRFLARESQVEQENFLIEKLIEDAFQEAIRQQASPGAKFKIETDEHALTVHGDRAALKHALAEILLNALQANPKVPHIGVKVETAGSNGDRALSIEVHDNGTGFNVETAKKSTDPFFTTRSVGLGLGLSVSQKIIETHHGRLEIVPSPNGIVRVFLPIESELNPTDL